MTVIYTAIGDINCNGRHINAGDHIEPDDRITEASLKQWAKKGLVRVNGSFEARDVVEVTSPDIVPGRSRRGSKLKDQADPTPEGEE